MENKGQMIYEFISGITDEQAAELIRAIKNGAFEGSRKPDRPASPSEGVDKSNTFDCKQAIVENIRL